MTIRSQRQRGRKGKIEMRNAVLLFAIFLTPFLLPRQGLGSPLEERPLCMPETGGGNSTPYLSLQTEAGSILIELFEKAVPRTARALADLAEGEALIPEVRRQLQKAGKAGYFDGLGFARTQPHVEISLEVRSPPDAIAFPQEIDAEALGLHRQLIADSGEAMGVMQRELLAVYTKKKKSGFMTQELRSLTDRWFETLDADFLIGKSQKQINEALGYSYRKGLASWPAVRGAVTLRPLSPTMASPALTILLTDVPARTGRWMVVGRVVEGMEVADSIGLSPRLPGPEGHKFFRPAEPPRVKTLRLVCIEDKP